MGPNPSVKLVHGIIVGLSDPYHEAVTSSQLAVWSEFPARRVTDA